VGRWFEDDGVVLERERWDVTAMREWWERREKSRSGRI
jgi:hypothetical protein